MSTFLRITRHPADAARVQWIRSQFGADTAIVERDVPFGNDPVAAIKGACAEVGNMVALEVVAPLPVLAQVLAARLGVPVVRAEFLRDSGGRAIVSGKDESGRDILAFSEYVEVVCVDVVTRRFGTP